MKRFLLSFLIGLWLVGYATAQDTPEPTHFHPCGTPPFKSDWLKRYQANPAAFAAFSRMETTIYLPISIHIVGDNNGAGYIAFDKLMNGFCTLNEDFEAAGIQFFIEGDFHFIDSTGWYIHSTVLQGADMMFANNIPNTINCYIVADPANNAGYNLPYAGIALNKAAASGGSNHTWAHEIGHALSIQHPFLGWEGKIYNYNTPTPLTVTYDYTYFKDSLITDTTIIDTAYVEFVNGSNCTFAADGFCDTPPDYLSGRWLCNAQGFSTILQKDPNGVNFYSDGTNIMSYSDDVCVTGFTPQQIAAMRANAQTEKAAYLYNQNPLRDSLAASVLNYPTQGTPVQFNAIELEWQSASNATHYIVQVSRLSSFAFFEYTGLTTDTTILLPALTTDRTYYWRVKPFNQGYTCAPMSSTASFYASDLVGIAEVSLENRLKVYPTVLSSGQGLQLEASLSEPLGAEIGLFNIAGQRLLSRSVVLKEVQTLDLPFLSAGVYILSVRTEGGSWQQKVVIY